MEEQARLVLATLTSGVVAAYVTKNALPPSELPALIASVSAAFEGLGRDKAPEPEELRPPVSIKRSITPDYLISLEDGRQYKSLKRHLAGRGLTPAQYREKWRLPGTYPMVAPNYSRQRSAMAKSLGPGQIRTNARAAAPTVADIPAETTKSARGGRKRKIEA